MAIDIYNQRAEQYSEYANGTCDFDELIKPPGDSGQFASGDMTTWQLIIDTVSSLSQPRAPFRILDIGCGDGVWSLRIADWLSHHGVPTKITLLDASSAMLAVATGYVDLFRETRPGAQVCFDLHEHDIREPWPKPVIEARFDLVLCLHTVLNHLTGDSRRRTLDQIFGLDSKRWAISVKPPGGPATLFAIPMSDILFSKQYENEIVALDRSGEFHRVPGAPLSSAELRHAYDAHGFTGQFYALDVFTSRFMPSGHGQATLEPSMLKKLQSLDNDVTSDPDFLDHANHLLNIVASD